ncbi:TPA: fimbrial protein [Escherichia coli]|nr:fimbrial protein [Escherichia coli]HAM4833690.1 fimbrial protein [Escherichia coli]HEG1790499.1 fimbrial protein [Escherichia coli]
MKIFKVIILEILILIFGISTDVRGESKDEIFNIEATFTTPSCKIIVPSTYHLGALTPGKVLQHSPLKLELSCSESVPLVTAIKGTVLAGTLSASKDKVDMLSLNQLQDSGAFLSLKHNDITIKLSGDDADMFCSDTQSIGVRECSLTPVTEVHTAARLGGVKSVIRFEIIYQ